MSIVGLLCLLFALIAALVLVLYALQLRDLRRLSVLSQQLQRIASGGRLPERVELASDKPEVAALVTAVNQLLTRAAAGGAKWSMRRGCLPSSVIASMRRCWCIVRSSCTPTGSLPVSSASIASSSSAGAWPIWSRPNTPSW